MKFKNVPTLLLYMAAGLSSASLYANVMAMPPKGGNADLTDKELGAVITYLRSLTGVTPDE